MNYEQLVYLHLATVLPCLMIGAFLVTMKKGTNIHKALGRFYLILMLTTGIITLFMQAKVGPRLFNHFGFIHSFSLLTLYSVPTAYFAAKKDNIAKHKGNMIGLYIGGLLIAGTFALMPGRLLHQWLFN